MSLKHKIKTMMVYMFIWGLIMPLIALFLTLVLEKYFILCFILLWVWIIMNIFAYYIEKVVNDIKYNACNWREYQDFVENGYTWFGRKVYLYKGVSRDIELAECLMENGNYQEALELLNDLSEKNDRKKEMDRYKILFFKCNCLWLSGRTEDFFAEKEKYFGKNNGRNSLKLEIYEKISKNEIAEARSLLEHFPVDCRYDFLWKEDTQSLIEGSCAKKKAFGDIEVPQIKIKFPALKISAAIILAFLLGVRIFAASCKDMPDEKSILVTKEEADFKVEVCDSKNKFHFYIYEKNEEDGQYNLISDWKYSKKEIWKVDFQNIGVDEELKETNENMFTSEVWLYIQFWKYKLARMEGEDKPDFLIGISRNSEIRDVTINDRPFAEIDAVETEEGIWYFYYMKDDEISKIREKDIKM